MVSMENRRNYYEEAIMLRLIKNAPGFYFRVRFFYNIKRIEIGRRL